MEPRDHYLALARAFAGKVQTCRALDEMLDLCWKNRERLWKGILSSDSVPVIRLASRMRDGIPTTVDFNQINSGPEQAHDYCGSVVSALKQICLGVLEYPWREVPLNAGRKRVDIVFTNVARFGFFHKMSKLVQCDYVVVECKNYTGEISNAEIDQLSGRLAPHRTELGILCCRSIKNRKKLIQRCSDLWKERRIIVIVLTDADLELLLDLARKNDSSGVSHHLHRAVDEIRIP